MPVAGKLALNVQTQAWQRRLTLRSSSTARFGMLGLVLFGPFGLACKILSWNRLVPILAFAHGRLLEEKLHAALVLSKGDLGAFMGRPISGARRVLVGTAVASIPAVAAGGNEVYQDRSYHHSIW